MASYHLSAKVISRGAGRSGIAAAAYRSCSKIHDERQGMTFDYSQKQHLGHSEILLPEGAPQWMKDRDQLWNTVEANEKRKDAQISREIEIALPTELSLAEQIELTRDFCNDNFVSQGMVADINIHAEPDNPHAHILLTMREVTPEGFGQKARGWNGRDNILKWREAWANIQNLHLAKAGFDIQVDHRSYAAMGIDLEPQIKLGASNHLKDQTQLDRIEEYNRIAKDNGKRLIKDPAIALNHLSYHHSVFSKNDIYKFALSHSCDQKQFDKVCDAIFKSKELVNLGQGEDGNERFTTKGLLKAEDEMLKTAAKMSTKNRHKVSENIITQASATRTMTGDQENAYRHVLNGGQAVAVVGYAGTGKSYTLGAVREAYESQGYAVKGMALSGIAAEGLQNDAGIKSKTIHRTLYDWDNGRELPNKKTVLVIDEAGMVGTRQMHRLTTSAKMAGAKIVLVGDYDQLQPIEAGGSFRGICERVGYFELTDVRRQKIDWQKDATKLLSGQPENVSRALDMYDENGHIKSYDTLNEAKQNLIEDWKQGLNDNGSKIILAYRNKDVIKLNHLARNEASDSGLLHGSEHKHETIKGDINLRAGDRVLFLRNENSMKVKNGTLGTIEEVGAKDVSVRLDSGRTVSFDTNFYKDFYYGYAATVHKTQGVTIDRTYVLGTKHFDKHSSYVALSRHRNDVKLYVSKDKEGFKSYGHMKHLMSRERPKALIKEYAEPRGVTIDLNKIYTRKYYDIRITFGSPEKEYSKRISVAGKYSHEEARQLAGNTAKDLAAKVSLSNNIKDVKDLTIKVQKLDASEIRKNDRSISKDLSPGRSY